MKKINKLISAIFSISMLASVSSISSNAYCPFPLEEMTRIDSSGYTDEFLLNENSVVLKHQYKLEDMSKFDNLAVDSFQFTLPNYYICNEYYDVDGVSKIFFLHDVQLCFLTYVLDTEEKYNEMSAYLAENYPDLELIKIDKQGIDNGDTSIDERFKYSFFFYGGHNYSYILKNIDDYLATSEEEMFEIALQIKKDLGYDLICIEDQSISSSVSAKCGDANFDDELTVADLVAYASYVGNAESNPLCDFAILLGDVHNRGDGITANDVLMIQQYLAGMIDSL